MFNPMVSLFLFFFSFTAYAQPTLNKLESSVVKIYAVSVSPNYYEPWKLNSSVSFSGSGSVIAGNRILTNAHVVADHRFIQIRKRKEAKKYQAVVEFIAHEYDLAILKVLDETFFDGMKPVEFGEIPLLRDKVITLGYPIGGDILSITEGVVSRIEHINYVHSENYLLSCQTDASINAGNSGGPVVKDEKMVGVAFQGGRGDNIGYFIPISIVKHFLHDVKDHTYDGMPSLGVRFQRMENETMRRYFNMDKTASGVLVNWVQPGSSADGLLFKNDVVLKIDHFDVDVDGKIEFRKDERTFLSYAIEIKSIGENAILSILRKGKSMTVKIPLKSSKAGVENVSPIRYDKLPSYYIFGGIVFEPLTVNLLRIWGRDWRSRAPAKFIEFYHKESVEEIKNYPVLLKVLADDVNVGYEDEQYKIIKKVNNQEVKSMEELVKIIELSEQSPYIVLEDANKEIFVLDRQKAEKSHQRIMEKYMISKRYSKDIEILLK